ncbi:MAG: LicD family protein [Solobacterium sp.]|nr:LicD family protein [Solobacterium sp.]
MKEYDDESLHKLQQIELMILRDSLKICKRHNIQMFGIAGTAIGAIRHHGFIPWDDDIDVAFLRKDYDEFVHYMKLEMSDKYTVMCTATDPNYFLMSTKIMLNGSKFREIEAKDNDCFFGIFLDVFVLDNLPNDEHLLKKQCKQSFIYSKLMILRSVAFPVLPYKGIKAKLTHFATAVIHGVLVLCHISKEKLGKQCLKIATRYNSEKDVKFVGYLFDTKTDIDTFALDDLFPLRPVKFEGIDFYLPKNIEKNLELVYGDFMQLPPVEKRKNHYPYELSFGKFDEYSTADIASGKYDFQFTNECSNISDHIESKQGE